MHRHMASGATRFLPPAVPAQCAAATGADVLVREEHLAFQLVCIQLLTSLAQSIAVSDVDVPVGPEHLNQQSI